MEEDFVGFIMIEVVYKCLGESVLTTHLLAWSFELSV